MAGCDVGTPENSAIDAPPVHLVEVRGTTSYTPAGCLGTTPPSCTTPVHTALMDGANIYQTSSFTLVFDRFLDPSTATRQSVCLRGTSTGAVTQLSDCTSAIFLNPSYDPVRREVTYRLTPGTKLTASTTYQLTVLSPPDSPDANRLNGFRAFDGAPLAATKSFLFTTPTYDIATPDELPPNADFYCKGGCDPTDVGCISDPATDCRQLCAQAPCPSTCATASDMVTCCSNAILSCKGNCRASTTLQGCAYGSCHFSAPGQVDPETASMGLDLSSIQAIATTAIGRVAHETMEGETSLAPDETSLRFGREMAIIDPENPGRSYLIYKLLVYPGIASTDPSLPPLAANDPSLAAGELDRLHASVVVGLPMPAAGNPISSWSIGALGQWIAAGAPTPACSN